MWKRRISHDIRFRMKTHICKAYVKNVMHEGYEIFVVVAGASFVKYHRTGRTILRVKNPWGECELLVLKTPSQSKVPDGACERGGQSKAVYSCLLVLAERIFGRTHRTLVVAVT